MSLSKCFPGSTKAQSWLIATLTCFLSLNVACCFSKLRITEWRWHWWTGLCIEKEGCLSEVSSKENKSHCCYLAVSARKSSGMEWYMQRVFKISAWSASAPSAKERGDCMKSSVGMSRRVWLSLLPPHRGPRSASSCYQGQKSNCTWSST